MVVRGLVDGSLENKVCGLSVRGDLRGVSKGNSDGSPAPQVAKPELQNSTKTSLFNRLAALPDSGFAPGAHT